MSGPVYLYSYGERRHIADPGDETYRTSAFRLTLCGEWHQTEYRMRLRFTTAYGPGVVADRDIARKLNEPVCQRCERKWALS